VREGPVLDDVQIVHDGARGVLVLPVRGSATSIVSQDNKAVRLAGDGDGSFGMDSPIATQVANRERNVDPASVLDGFVITSHSSNRAIITGPGGSRIVFNGEEIVIGGFVWEVNIRSSGIEFRGNGQSVLLLFDRALSSGGGRASSTRTTPTAAAPATGN
jgi:hypothetical protein